MSHCVASKHALALLAPLFAVVALAIPRAAELSLAATAHLTRLFDGPLGFVVAAGIGRERDVFRVLFEAALCGLAVEAYPSRGRW